MVHGSARCGVWLVFALAISACGADDPALPSNPGQITFPPVVSSPGSGGDSNPGTASGVGTGAAPDPSGQQPSIGDTRELLIGQSSQGCWADYQQQGGTPSGGSVYYEVKSGHFNGGAEENHTAYARFLAERGDLIQIGVSWKDNPPGWTGTGDNGPAAREATVAISRGDLDGQFGALIDFIKAYPGARFLIRIDYEVSSYYHCSDDNCDSYKAAFNHVAELIRSRVGAAAQVKFVFHPVRGEFEKMYPGDAKVDYLGISIFNHELCLPIYNQGQTLTNGAPGVGFDPGTNQCKGYVIERVNGNAAARAASFDYDQNVLLMLKFARDHQKPVVVSESAPMNFEAGQSQDGTERDELVTTWVNRLFGLLTYQGSLPNLEGLHDLSGVIRVVTYINADLRYGWDGQQPGQTEFRFPYDSDWHINAQIHRYALAFPAFCQGLSKNAFRTRCP